jgi:ribosomal protein S18 acetylase RimI-like enzyme
LNPELTIDGLPIETFLAPAGKIVRLRVRPATSADVPALVALVNSAYRGETSRAGWTTEADLLDGQRVDADGLAADVATPDVAVLIAEENDEPAPALIGCVKLHRQGSDCYLGMLTIRPTAQGAGLGSRLLEAAERWAVTHWSAHSVHLTVIAQRSELIAWYERRGYRRTDEQRPFPYGDARFGLPRRDDLVFDVLRKVVSP